MWQRHMVMAGMRTRSWRTGVRGWPSLPGGSMHSHTHTQTYTIHPYTIKHAYKSRILQTTSFLDQLNIKFFHSLYNTNTHPLTNPSVCVRDFEQTWKFSATARWLDTPAVDTDVSETSNRLGNSAQPLAGLTHQRLKQTSDCVRDLEQTLKFSATACWLDTPAVETDFACGKLAPDPAVYDV